MIRFFSFFIGLVFFPAMMSAQQYEGDRNKKGEPNGQGVITFNLPNGMEKLEGTFEKGMPVNGKSMRFDQYGRLIMEFEGNFRPRVKGKFTNLGDLLAIGNIVFFYYENSKTYNDIGYGAGWGNYDGNAIKNKTVVGVKNVDKNTLSPQGRKYYEFLLPQYAYSLMKDKGDALYSRLIKNHGVFDVPSVDQNMEHYSITDMCGNVSNNNPDGTVYGLACKDNDSDQLYYFKGDFDNGQLKKIITLKQYVKGGKYRKLYINSEAQKITPFLSEEDFKEFMLIDGEDKTISQLRRLLQDPEKKTKLNIEKAKVILATTFKNHFRQGGFGMFDILHIFEETPEIANATDVIVKWDGSEKTNMNDAMLEYLRWQRDEHRINNLPFYYRVYKNWSTLSEDEIYDAEANLVLSHDPFELNKYYKDFFPNGRYAGKDFVKEAWAMAYIDNYKRVLKKNDPTIWIGRSNYDSHFYFDWLHYPMLTEGIGEYSERTQLTSLLDDMLNAPRENLFNKRKISLLKSIFSPTGYIFVPYNHHVSGGDFLRIGAFNVLDEGPLLEEAKMYRSVMDGIALADQVTESKCKYVDRTDLPMNLQTWYACHLAYDYLVDGIIAARNLSASTPEIRPACKKAEEFILEKIKMLENKVFIYDEAWAKKIQENKASYNKNKEAEEKMLQEIENLGLPTYEYEDNTWQKDYDEVYRKICFKDLTDVSCTKIWKANDGSYYKTVAGAFLYAKYRTERDAIIAAYAYLKYGEVRQKGRIK